MLQESERTEVELLVQRRPIQAALCSLTFLMFVLPEALIIRKSKGSQKNF